MEGFSEEEIGEWQLVIARCYYKRHQAHLWLFGDKDSYFYFLFGCAGLGIAQAFANKDRFNKERGSFYWFCCLKSFEVIRDELSKEYRRKRSFSDEVLKELHLHSARVVDETREADERDMLSQCLALLSPDQRDVLILIDYLGCPAKEAATVLERNIDAIYSLLKRARRRARELYPRCEHKAAG